jgi:hypothetical protein
MATVTVFTSARMQAIENASVVSGTVTAGNLILTKFNGTTINAGSVIGPTGPTGPTGEVTTAALNAAIATVTAAGAVTETQLATGSVTTIKLVNGSVTADKLASNAVSTIKILDGNVTEGKLASNSVSTVKIADGNVTEGKLASNSVTVNKIADLTITNAKISNSTITNAKISASAGIELSKLATTGTITATTGYFAGGLVGGNDYSNALSIGGGYTTNGLGVLRIGKYTGNVTGITINQQAGYAPYYMISFYNLENNVGSISQDGSNTSYNTSSDYRLKENVQTLEGALSKIEALLPKTYNFVTTPDVVQHGFLAHELAEVVPYAVTGEKDAVDEQGNIQPQQVDYSKLTGLLVGAVQELSARVQELENN